jgi:hypothetical protein
MRINKTDSALLRGYGKPKRLSTDGTDVLSLADLESHLHISLLPEPSSISVPLLILRHPLQIESLQNKRNKLAHLHDGNILPNARAGAVAELKRTQSAISHMTCCIQKQDITYYQHRSLHEFQLRGIRLQPIALACIPAHLHQRHPDQSAPLAPSSTRSYPPRGQRRIASHLRVGRNVQVANQRQDANESLL